MKTRKIDRRNKRNRRNNTHKNGGGFKDFIHRQFSKRKRNNDKLMKQINIYDVPLNKDNVDRYMLYMRLKMFDVKGNPQYWKDQCKMINKIIHIKSKIIKENELLDDEETIQLLKDEMLSFLNKVNDRIDNRIMNDCIDHKIRTINGEYSLTKQRLDQMKEELDQLEKNKEQQYLSDWNTNKHKIKGYSEWNDPMNSNKSDAKIIHHLNNSINEKEDDKKAQPPPKWLNKLQSFRTYKTRKHSSNA